MKTHEIHPNCEGCWPLFKTAVDLDQKSIFQAPFYNRKLLDFSGQEFQFLRNADYAGYGLLRYFPLGLSFFCFAFLFHRVVKELRVNKFKTLHHPVLSYFKQCVFVSL